MHVEQETWPSASKGEEVMLVFRDHPLADIPPYLHVAVLEGPASFEVRSGTGPDTDSYTVDATIMLEQVNRQDVVKLPASTLTSDIVTTIRVLTGRVTLSVHSPLPFRMEFRSRRYRA